MAPTEDIVDVQTASRRSRAASPVARKSTGDDEGDKTSKTCNETTKENIVNSSDAGTQASQKAVQTKVEQEFASRFKLVARHAKDVFEDLCYSRRGMIAVLMLLSTLLVACPILMHNGIRISVGWEVARPWLHKIREAAAETSSRIFLATVVSTIVAIMLVCFIIRRRRSQRAAVHMDAGKKVE